MRYTLLIMLFALTLQTSYSQAKKTSKSIFELLQGKWQSIEDKKSYLVIEGNIRKDNYGSEEDKGDKFWLSNSCESSFSSSATNKNGKYIVMKDMCWEMEVNENYLTLTYVGRGNTFTYKKVGLANSPFFAGTKKFCDEEGYWYYKVTINGTHVTIQSFAGKNNTAQKNKMVAKETTAGTIRNKKIFVKDDSAEYNRYKYENGKLSIMNNEGSYEDYTECK